MMRNGKKNLGASYCLFPAPVVLCGTYDAAGRPNLATLSAVGVCSTRPPVIQIGVMPARHSHAAILLKQAFSLNIPSRKYLPEADYCGIAGGRKVDKFARTGLTPVRGTYVEAPLVGEFPVCMECRLIQCIELVSHDLFLGEVVATWVAEDAVGDDGWIDPRKVDAFCYMLQIRKPRVYHAVGEPLAPAFEAGKVFMQAGE